MNNILGGTFMSRINMNLREDKHWSYGAFSAMFPARGQRPFIAGVQVQTDKTKESMVEIEKELRGIVGKQPITEDELRRAQHNQTLSLPGQWETNESVRGAITDIVSYGLPDDYFTTYPEKVRALSLDDLTHAAVQVLHPGKLVWVVVGDPIAHRAADPRARLGRDPHARCRWQPNEVSSGSVRKLGSFPRSQRPGHRGKCPAADRIRAR